MLIVIAAACALFAGIGMGRKELRSRFYRSTFAAILTITVFVIVDMEFPRVGLIRIDALDQVLTQVRADMN